MKRLLIYSLLVTILVTTLFTSLGPITVYAKETGTDNDAQKQSLHFVTAEEAGSSKIGVKYGVKEGDLIFITINQKAQSGIKYQTAGWIVRKTPVCSDYGKVTEASKLTATCSPTADGKILRLPKSDFKPFPPEDYPVAGKPMHVKNVVTMTYEKFSDFLATNSNFIDTKNGDILFFNTILQVNRNGTPQFPVYRGIKTN
jgi:hypothetical protein